MTTSHQAFTAYRLWAILICGALILNDAVRAFV
jgi:hypothetical protein